MIGEVAEPTIGPGQEADFEAGRGLAGSCFASPPVVMHTHPVVRYE
ncbi:hypothetical protein KYK29_09240 [Shinella daejeonensis]|nr:hypothetical protein [Shinella daejeonensis]MCP8895114.1 hypothetical protein [Shinella daejeonensis]